MELFIQKMEALLFTKRPSFFFILRTITVIGLILFWSPIFLALLPEKWSDHLTEYIKVWGWVLLVAGILWILVLWSEAESGISLEDFLENIGNKEFTRHDFAKFLYGKEVEAKDYKYKRLGRILRNAIGDLIQESWSKNNRITYKKIEKENKQKNTKKRNSKKWNKEKSDL